jgi:tripartite-type tricarboxylate transporter receptor subunit TctC
MITKRRLLSLACTGGLAVIFPDATRTAAAEPASRMLVGFGVGGAIDVIARLLVEGMKDYAPSFIVDNRPGAGGRLALGVLKSSPANGTTMILAPASNFAVFPHVYKALGYDAVAILFRSRASVPFPS